MSGFPSFQGSPHAFRDGAFQAGVVVVAGNYAVGSPSFSTPAMTIKVVSTAPAYAVGSPSFATPTLRSGIKVLTVSAYSLGSPSFAAIFARAVHMLNATSYSISSPSFFNPAIHQVHRFFTNFYYIGSPIFAKPRYLANYQLHPPTQYITGSPIFFPVTIVQIESQLSAGDYWITPSFGYPRLQWQAVDILGLPPTYLSQVQDAAKMLQGYLNLILQSIPPVHNDQTDTVRRLASSLRDNAEAAIRGSTLGTQLQDIHNAAYAANASYIGVENARQYLIQQVTSTSIFTQMIYRNALVMCLALESNILVNNVTYKSRDDAQQAIVQVRTMFDQAKELGIDLVDVQTYQLLNTLGGSVINHLAVTQLQLPRFMTWHSSMPMPSLYLANRIYADASRYEEIAAENGVIHPAFCPMDLRVLSNVGR